jgi:protein TonB
MRYALPTPPEAPWEKAVKLTLIFGLHGLLLFAAVTMTFRPHVMEILASIDLRVIEDKPSLPEPEKPEPPVPRPQVTQPDPLPEPPVLTAAADAPVAASFSVPAQPPAPAEIAAPQLAPVVAARFDADYLHNPAPTYPMVSRRNHEEGRVLLKVLVSAEGATKNLLVQQSSGFAHLDDAATEAVRKWRFVAARRGSEAVEDWVLVPIVFRLDR